MSIVTKEWTKKFEEAEYLDEIIEGLEALQKRITIVMKRWIMI